MSNIMLFQIAVLIFFAESLWFALDTIKTCSNRKWVNKVMNDLKEAVIEFVQNRHEND